MGGKGFKYCIAAIISSKSFSLTVYVSKCKDYHIFCTPLSRTQKCQTHKRKKSSEEFAPQNSSFANFDVEYSLDIFWCWLLLTPSLANRWGPGQDFIQDMWLPGTFIQDMWLPGPIPKEDPYLYRCWDGGGKELKLEQKKKKKPWPGWQAILILSDFGS